ncbi:MAG TPA: asparaginase [Alphaproteobacteria bacterium]|nr:asparaginase [Alphaproteobacteria bacterium]
MTELLAQPRDGGHAPLIVEVIRGDMVESRHAVSFAAVDSAGRRIAWRGEIESPVFARSAVKGLQALPLVETGAADRWAVDASELALACASHSGEPRHVERVLHWLERIGLSQADLECGSHTPFHEPSAAALIAAGLAASPAHNNCSGKHAGFLATARHMGERVRGYIEPTHPVQQRVTRVLEEMCGVDLSRAPRGIDGCGIPVMGVPLEKLALGMARIADPGALPPDRRAAVDRIRSAVAAEPFMLAGTGRFCTEVMECLGARAFVKTGAEGVFCAALPEQGIGIALKTVDGAGRAVELVVAHLLESFGLLDELSRQNLALRLHPPVFNRVGRLVGAIRINAGEA